MSAGGFSAVYLAFFAVKGVKKMSLHIELFVGAPDKPYRSLGMIEARAKQVTNFSAAPTIEDVNLALQESAAQLGANGVINITYDRGISWTSWNVLTGKGEAVVFEADDRACPICAETIKRAALKCRFCGSDVA